VAAYLPTFTGNLAGGNAIITSSVSAATFTGSGAALTNLPGANVTGVVANASYATAAGSATTATSASTAVSATTAATVTTAAQPNITSVGTLSVLSTSGNISAVGNIAGSYFIGNGAALTGIVANTTYNDSNVAAFLPTYTGAMTAMLGNVTTTANVSGAYIKGNGSQLTGMVSSIVAGPGISISGSTGAVTITNNNPNAYTNSNVTSLLASFGSNTISTTGSITGGNILGNGSGLTGLVTSIIAGAGISVNAATGAVTVTATGGGGSGTSISNGTSNVSIPSTNGGVFVSVAGTANVVTVSGLTGNSVGVTTLGSISAPKIYVTSGISSPSGSAQIANLETTGTVTFGAGVVNANTTTNLNSTTTVTTGQSLILDTNATLRASLTTKTGTSTGTTGSIVWDGSYIYVCTASNVWKRVALSSF
jgi:hypothetical protein